MERGMGCLGSSSSHKCASARQSSNMTTIKGIKTSGTNIRSSDASNNKAVDTKQRKFLVYPQDESSFGGLSQPSSISWESSEVPAFGPGDLEGQQFSFDAKSFFPENRRITPRSLSSVVPKAALSYNLFGQWNPNLGRESLRGSRIPSDPWHSDGEEEAEETSTGKQVIKDYFSLLYKNEERTKILTLSKDELQKYQRNISSPFYKLSLPHSLETVYGQLHKIRKDLNLDSKPNPGERFYGIKIPRRTNGRLDFCACPRLDVKNWHEILTNMTQNNNWLLEIYRRHAPRGGDDKYEACQKCEDLREFKRGFPMLIDMEKAVCN
jgi:hypothetical protein